LAMRTFLCWNMKLQLSCPPYQSPTGHS
jgi:hypothetical protein